MQKYTYIKGDKFGEFTLLDDKLSGRRSVKCICGNIRQKTNTELTKVLNNELDPKCNICMMKERREDPLFMYREILSQYKRHAREKGLEYSLSDDQFLYLVQSNCNYCGLKPSNYLSKKKVTDKVTKQRRRFSMSEKTYYSGIDRVDNKKGYLEENCVACCNMCNKGKHYHSVEDFTE